MNETVYHRDIYFVRALCPNGPVKIGSTIDVPARMKVVANWAPFKLELIAETPGDYVIEKRFHALFRPTHSHGEWFFWSALMSDVVKELRAGTFDLATLPPPVCLVGRNARPAA